MSRRPAAVPAALLALAAAAAAFDQPVIWTPTCTHNNFRVLEAILPSILARSLRASRNSQGLPAAEYLDAHLGVAFRIAVDPSQQDAFGGRATLGPTTMMSYSDSDQEIDIHHALLHLDGSDEAMIIREPARLEKTVARFWPVIVHETSHARTHQGDARFVGDSVIEDEYIAFYREIFFVLEQLETDRGYLGLTARASCARDLAALLARFRAFEPRLKELSRPRTTAAERRERGVLAARADALAAEQKTLQGHCPDFDAPDSDLALLLALFARSNGALEESVRKTYEKKNRLSLDDPELISRARAETEGDIRQFSGFLADDLPAQVPESDPKRATLIAMDESSRRILDTKRKALVFWNDPKEAPAIVKAYKSLLSAVRAQADEKRERYQLVLKPFLPEGGPGYSSSEAPNSSSGLAPKR